MLMIKAILDAEKNATLNGIPDKAIYVPKKSKSDYPKVQFGSRYKQNRNKYSHDCSSSSQCNTKWDKLGCIELYKLTTVEERKDMLISNKTCFKCGAPFTRGIKAGKYLHSCKWFPGDKRQARCQGQNGSKPCYFAAATCLVHKNKASRELKSWLAKSKLKVDGVGVDCKPSIPENLREKRKLIELLKSENGNLDAILSSYKERKELQVMEKKSNLMNSDEDAKHTDAQDKAPLDENPAKIIEKERKIKSDLENPEINRTREPPRIVKRSPIYTEILECLKLSQQQLGLPLYASRQRPGVNVKQTGGDRCGGRGQPVGGGGIEREQPCATSVIY